MATSVEHRKLEGSPTDGSRHARTDVQKYSLTHTHTTTHAQVYTPGIYILFTSASFAAQRGKPFTFTEQIQFILPLSFFALANGPFLLVVAL